MNVNISHNATSGWGLCLKDLREILNLTQAELANLAGLSRSAIIDFEQEKHVPRIETIFRICEALEITPSELFAHSLRSLKINHNKKEREELHKALRRAMCKTLTGKSGRK